MTMTQLEIKQIYNKPYEQHEAVVIWLHGLGADCNDFIPLVPELRLTTSVKFIFPNAPIIPITINNNFRMRGWYDILSFDNLRRNVDDAGIIESVAQIESIIDSEIASGIPANKIVLAGFSQGGVITYYAGLNSKHDLTGMLVLSAYLPKESLLNQENLANKTTKILICHGTTDEVVNIQYAKEAIDICEKSNLDFVWEEYPMGHSVCPSEIKDIATFLKEVL